MLSPYFSAILWAAILTIIFNPVKNKLRTALGDRNGLASLLTLGIICLIVFIPLMVILSSLAVELNMVYTKLQQNNTQFPEVIAGIFNRLPDWASGCGGSQPDQRRADPEKAFRCRVTGRTVSGG